MAGFTIEIHSDGPHYPNGKVVHPNETVTFTLVGIQGEVDVTFETPCCFTSSAPLTLDSSSLAASSQQKTVSADARDGDVSHFSADIPDRAREHRPPDWEAKRGEVDVSTDGGWFR